MYFSENIKGNKTASENGTYFLYLMLCTDSLFYFLFFTFFYYYFFVTYKEFR